MMYELVIHSNNKTKPLKRFKRRTRLDGVMMGRLAAALAAFVGILVLLLGLCAAGFLLHPLKVTNETHLVTIFFI